LLDPLSPISEAYRGLRTSVRFASIDRSLRTLMISSPGPTEGKSLTLANLGVVFAQSGLKVLIVDTDLRRPVQHAVFGLSNSRGLCDLFLDPELELSDYVQPTTTENLYLLPAGQPPPNPSELLASERLGQVMARALEEMDLILLDSPPALVVTDAAVLGSRVDGVLLVTDLRKTHRKMAAKGAEELRRTQSNLLGVILNRVTPTRSGYYYHYGYYYRHQNDDHDGGDETGRPRRRRRRRWLPRLGGKRPRQESTSAATPPASAAQAPEPSAES
ncbi:MAG: CpsD/CapB family tyrosine-protein kinase, partial [Anaerolineae bacterium]|nr:CpsD/CapB family tyrosine-protein kinase [Anaerolineae bacterium]